MFKFVEAFLGGQTDTTPQYGFGLYTSHIERDSATVFRLWTLSLHIITFLKHSDRFPLTVATHQALYF